MIKTKLENSHLTIHRYFRKIQSPNDPANTADLMSMMGTSPDPEAIRYMRNLLEACEPFNNSSDISDQDASNLIGFIINLLDNDLIGQTGIKNANSKSRRLAIKLSTKVKVIHESLFLSPSKLHVPNSFPIGYGGQAIVYGGTYQGVPVALKRINKEEIDKDFCREVISWRMTSHKYVLPFIGVYVDLPQKFISLVSPFMENGTLNNWRKTNNPSLTEIKKRILEVAEGLQYLHSVGIIHGDLRGSNVLLDFDCQVKISDFGLARHFDATATESETLSWNFAAPELFGDEDEMQLKRTPETDVYAFGCLCYEIYFNIIPFSNCRGFRIASKVKSGKRAARPSSPSIEDKAWSLIDLCWRQIPDERPVIENIVCSMLTWASY